MASFQGPLTEALSGIPAHTPQEVSSRSPALGGRPNGLAGVRRHPDQRLLGREQHSAPIDTAWNRSAGG